MIYFARSGTDGPIKIGHSKNPLERLAALRTSAHVEVLLMATLEGGPEVEEAIHQRFAAARVRGEWFAPTGDLISFIETTATPYQKKPREVAPPRVKPQHSQPPPISSNELREWRRKVAFTQSRAASHLGCSLKAYQNWEQGIRDMRHPIAMRKLMATARARKETVA